MKTRTFLYWSFAYSLLWSVCPGFYTLALCQILALQISAVWTVFTCNSFRVKPLQKHLVCKRIRVDLAGYWTRASFLNYWVGSWELGACSTYGPLLYPPCLINSVLCIETDILSLLFSLRVILSPKDIQLNLNTFSRVIKVGYTV